MLRWPHDRSVQPPPGHQDLGISATLGMKAHIGVDAASGLVHTVVGTAANISDINVAGALLHGEEHAAFGATRVIRACTSVPRPQDRPGM
jgi:IS5 family transposase